MEGSYYYEVMEMMMIQSSEQSNRNNFIRRRYSDSLFNNDHHINTILITTAGFIYLGVGSRCKTPCPTESETHHTIFMHAAESHNEATTL